MHEAQLAEELSPARLVEFLHDDDWWLEQKLDGHRLLVPTGGLDLLNRNGVPYSKNVPSSLLDNLKKLERGHILDGELLDGHLWLFDLLEFDGYDTKTYSFSDRRRLLESIPLPGHVSITPVARTSQEKFELAQRTLRNRAEGVIIKNKASTYHAGQRSTGMLKVKYTHTADVVVLEVGRDGKSNAVMGLYDNGDFIEVGTVSTLHKGLNLMTQDVLEVQYLYATDDDRLYQPRILRKRDDKDPTECSITQLCHTNKEVLT